MRIPRTIHRARVRTGLAAVAISVLAGGVWHGAASAQAARPTPAAVASAPVAAPIGHDAIGTRTSYADLVKAVAPSVVTIRTESTATTSRTALQGDDFFRRFFGEDPRGDRREPQPYRQR